jgi:hypothetical protein
MHLLRFLFTKARGEVVSPKQAQLLVVLRKKERIHPFILRYDGVGVNP